MKRLLLIAALALAGTACGPVKGLDPLGGLGGADSSRYGFESGIQAWACATEATSSCFSLSHVQGRSLFGSASLGVQLFQMGNHYAGGPCAGPPTDNMGRISLDLSAAPPDLSGKTLTAWVYLPAAAQASTESPTQAQIYLIDGGDVFANGAATNLKTDNWTLISFAPKAWAGPGVNQVGGVYVNPGFNPVAAKRMGLKFASSGTAPCDFTFTGTLLVDSIDW